MKRFSLAIVFVVLIEIFINILFTGQLLGQIQGLFLARTIQTAILIFLLPEKLYNSFFYLVLSPKKVFTKLGFTLRIVLAITFAGIIIKLIAYYFDHLNLQINHQFSDSSTLYLLLFCLVSPIAEELFFRGFAFKFFRRWSYPIALFISLIAFVALHSPDLGNIFIPIFGGFLTTIAYEKDQTILAPIIVHCVGNMLLFICFT